MLAFNASSQTFLITNQPVWQTSALPADQKWHPLFDLDGILVAYPGQEKPPLPGTFSCTLPLITPIDSILQLAFHSSRELKNAAFLVTANDSFTVQPLKNAQFSTFNTPLKEVNLFYFPGLMQDELYVELNPLFLQNDSLQIADLLFFEFLFEQFLRKKIVRGKVFGESLIGALATDYRPVYAPELHFYLSPRSALAIFEKWDGIKKSFRKFLHSSTRKKAFKQFKQQLLLVSQSKYSKLVVWSKLLQRYGYMRPARNLAKIEQRIKSDRWPQTMERFVDHLIIYWFRAEPLESDQWKNLKNRNLFK